MRSRRFLRTDSDQLPMAVPESIARATHALAQLVGARLVITPTVSGSTARLVAATKPVCSVLALSTSAETVRRLCLTWGVEPRLIEPVENTDDLFEVSRREALSSGMAKAGDRIVITSGMPFDEAGSTSLLKVMEL